MVPALKSFALLDINTNAVYVVSAADILVAAMQVDESAGGENNRWYRKVPESRKHSFLTEADAGYVVYNLPNGCRPTSEDEDLLSFSVAGYVEITTPEELE